MGHVVALSLPPDRLMGGTHGPRGVPRGSRWVGALMIAAALIVATVWIAGRTPPQCLSVPGFPAALSSAGCIRAVGAGPLGGSVVVDPPGQFTVTWAYTRPPVQACAATISVQGVFSNSIKGDEAIVAAPSERSGRRSFPSMGPGPIAVSRDGMCPAAIDLVFVVTY